MTFSSQVMEVTRKALSPKFREEIKRELCRTGMRYRILGVKPLTGKKKEQVENKVDAMSMEEVEAMYIMLFPPIED